ncbi:LysR family transcriptional regulator [Labrys monachus]|uniref:DNA-binding transcriptional LysR family regulator n=1 Tax=Labrys monachus TaxID=217067 RepID=A0ABU0FGW6_9HYPH|nr:LysR family transcriptional regulator [Labrys monachus]MDQ0393771.1 DNA-binding transcriptional LysR family regulator [Labrys monachus]
MSDLALDLRHLKFAVLVAEQGSFRRAAFVLNLSQSTVSRRVQLLERRLGILLFERSRIGVRPTEVGQRFLREAAIGASQIHDAINGIATTLRGEAGQIRIGIAASLAHGSLAALLDAFTEHYPNIALKLHESTSQANAAKVQDGHLDAAFILGEPRFLACERKHLWNEAIYLCVPADHRFSRNTEISWADIRDETFLVNAEGAGPDIEDYLLHRVMQFGSRPKIVAQQVGRENLLNLVARGLGITLTWSSTASEKYPGVVVVPIGSSTDVVRSSVIWLAANRNPALRRLLALAEKIADTNRLVGEVRTRSG